MVPIWLNPLEFSVEYRQHQKCDNFCSQDCLLLIKSKNNFTFAIEMCILYLLSL